MARGDNFKGKPRRGGRVKGTPNKRTLEAMEKEQITKQISTEVRSVPSRKLAKEVLEDWMFIFQSTAAPFQNRVALAMQANTAPMASDYDGLQRWGELVIHTAKMLADFQSPKFRAVQLMTNPIAPLIEPPRNDNRLDLDDPVALVRHYQRTMKLVKG